MRRQLHGSVRAELHAQDGERFRALVRRLDASGATLEANHFCWGLARQEVTPFFGKLAHLLKPRMRAPQPAAKTP
jgi:hypothetical protein